MKDTQICSLVCIKCYTLPRWLIEVNHACTLRWAERNTGLVCDRDAFPVLFCKERIQGLYSGPELGPCGRGAVEDTGLMCLYLLLGVSGETVHCGPISSFMPSRWWCSPSACCAVGFHGTPLLICSDDLMLRPSNVCMSIQCESRFDVSLRLSLALLQCICLEDTHLTFLFTSSFTSVWISP